MALKRLVWAQGHCWREWIARSSPPSCHSCWTQPARPQGRRAGQLLRRGSTSFPRSRIRAARRPTRMCSTAPESRMRKNVPRRATKPSQMSRQGYQAHVWTGQAKRCLPSRSFHGCLSRLWQAGISTNLMLPSQPQPHGTQPGGRVLRCCLPATRPTQTSAWSPSWLSSPQHWVLTVWHTARDHATNEQTTGRAARERPGAAPVERREHSPGHGAGR